MAHPYKPSDLIIEYLGHLGLSDKQLCEIEENVEMLADIMVRGHFDALKEKRLQATREADNPIVGDE